MLDLDAYIERIGLSGHPRLAGVHRAHATTIPFENLDPHRGLAVSLEEGELERKLVQGRRGGYCFEQNMLLKGALEALGARVETMLARVLYGAPPGVVRPRAHLVLRVHAEGTSWLADVGFGLGTLLEPLQFAHGAEGEQSGWCYRLIEREDGELVLQTLEEPAWVDMYEFSSRPSPPIDLEISNWWTATHPRSPFVTGLMLGLYEPSGRRLSLTDFSGQLALVEATPGERCVTPLERGQLPELLAARFSLEGFTLDARGRVVLAGD
jgi:N-hydroxyarylamine O-acetyltransferase